MKLLWLLSICLLSSAANGGVVTGFVGDVAVRDQDGYELAAYQYATSSNQDGSMRPKMVLFATNDNDVLAAINYAKMNNVAMAVRTGGHQYSGASSTGGDNILLDMSRTYLEFEWNETTGLLRVGISWALRELDARMGSMGLFVPHGQCSNVHVGGHAQTGGWGSLCRGFGLFGDHIQMFEIFTADGKKRMVHRDAQNKDEKDLFYAVLGGSPGNFGVLTHVTLRVHRNTEHPDSRGLKVLYLYSKPVLKALLNVLVDMVNDNELAGDWDYCVSLASASAMTDSIPNVTAYLDETMLAQLGLLSRQAPSPAPVIFVFAEWANVVSGQTFDPTSSSNWFKKMTDAATAAGAIQVFQQFGPSVHTSMTDMNAAWVFGSIREFVTPFVKSGRVTDSTTLVQDGFVNFITDQIHNVISTPNSGLHLSGQFQVIGGKNSMFGRPPPGETAYSWRKSNAVFTLDAFYEVDPMNAAHDRAVAFLEDVAQCVGPTGSWCPDERRVLWSSYGDHNMQSVWPYYYENRTKYDRLVRTKRQVDPKGLFTPNEFVVGGNFVPKGKMMKGPKIDDRDYAPKLTKKRDLEFEALIHPKAPAPKGSSGKGAAAIGGGACALGVVLAVVIRRRRNRTPTKPNDANCASSSTTTVTTSV